jgi:hypothetical protein
MTERDRKQLIKRLCVPEAVHTAFRKGGQSPESMKIWHLIHDMEDDWTEVVNFIEYCFDEHLKHYRIRKVVNTPIREIRLALKRAGK